MSEQEREHVAAHRAFRELRRADENLKKRQYWNTLACLNEATRATMEAFDSVLKRGAPELAKSLADDVDHLHGVIEGLQEANRRINADLGRVERERDTLKRLFVD